MRRFPRHLVRAAATLACAGAAAGCAVQAHGTSATEIRALSSTSSGSAGDASAPHGAPATAPGRTVQLVSTKPPCSAAAAACVSLSRLQAWFGRDGQVMRGPVRVEIGGPGHETAPGTFRVYRKERMWHSTIYQGEPMPFSVFFDGGNAFHEGWLNAPSHGCVHLSASDAAWAFGFLHIGDEVQVVV